MISDAVERHGHPRPGGRLYTCEHASNRVPAPWRPRPADRRLLAMHWGYDIGAAVLTRELARLGGDAAVLSRFSRLLVDPNRAPDDPTLVLGACPDGAPTFNTRPDTDLRLTRFHAPFHEAVNAALPGCRVLLSVHSFTDVWQGVPRTLDAGVLFDRHDDLAARLVRALTAEGLQTRPNEPYSGKDGLIYSAARHGAAAGVPYLEIELRQGLLRSGRAARAMARRVHRAIVAAGL